MSKEKLGMLSNRKLTHDVEFIRKAGSEKDFSIGKEVGDTVLTGGNWNASRNRWKERQERYARIAANYLD